ncbi:MAG: hypothetical protein WCA78_02810, partial [Rhizomicrobium sp.]
VQSGASAHATARTNHSSKHLPAPTMNQPFAISASKLIGPEPSFSEYYVDVTIQSGFEFVEGDAVSPDGCAIRNELAKNRSQMGFVEFRRKHCGCGRW